MYEFISGFISIVTALGSLVFPGSVPPIQTPVEDSVQVAVEENFGTTKPAGLFTYYLSGGGISSSATSFTLTSLTLPQNDYPIQDSDLSDTFYLTIEPGNTSRQEFISCTTVGTNTGSSVIISGCTRGLSPVSPYTASSSLQFTHSGGSAVIFSDSPQLFEEYGALANDETVTGQWTFTTFPITASSSFASTTASGWVELATGLEAASSTASGNIASSSLALHTGISTSTPPSSGHVIPVTGIADGNLAEGFLPTTLAQNYTLTGSSTFTGTTTFTGPLTGHASTTITQYTASTTWSKPAGLEYIIVEVIGGGGGGGAEGTNVGVAGGGGGGGYSKEVLNAADLAATSTVTITIGVGGAGGSAGNNNGVTGGTTLFSSFLQATGGVGGTTSNSGGDGGDGGTGSGGDVNMTSESGESGYVDAGADTSVWAARSGGAPIYGASCGGGGDGGTVASAGGVAGNTGCVIIQEVF